MATLAATASDTIYALSSGKGRSGVAVIRLSGSNALSALNALCTADEARHHDGPRPKRGGGDGGESLGFIPRQMVLRRLYHPSSREHLDTGLVVYFAGPRSFTGEDMVELHVHGGTAVSSAILGALGTLQGVRAADAGEFTRRAFVAGRLDMTEAEGINDLIDAETQAQRAQALAQMEGRQAKVVARWRTELVRCLAHVEAVIDFSEDEPVGEEVARDVVPRVERIRQHVSSHLSDGRVGERLRQGASVVLAGAPNAGKSSLLNSLAQRDAAIVSPMEGTTRDVLHVPMEIGGYPVQLFDTAGLRGISWTESNDTHPQSRQHAHHGDGDLSTTIDVVEQEGISRALSTLSQSDVRIVVLDATRVLQIPSTAAQDASNPSMTSTTTTSSDGGEGFERLSERETDETLQMLNATLSTNHDEVTSSKMPPKRALVVVNKCDLISTSQEEHAMEIIKNHARGIPGMDECMVHCVSCKSGSGISELRKLIHQTMEEVFSTSHFDDAPIVTRARHREQLEKCMEALDRYLDRPLESEIAAEELREALQCIGRLTGHVDVEDLLDVIFKDFCIGK